MQLILTKVDEARIGPVLSRFLVLLHLVNIIHR